jgi:hypothetical protein
MWTRLVRLSSKYESETIWISPSISFRCVWDFEVWYWCCVVHILLTATLNVRLFAIVIQAFTHAHTHTHTHTHTHIYIYIVTCLVTVDGVLDWQSDLLDQTQLHTITVYTLHYSLFQLQLFSEYCCSARILTRNSLSKTPSRTIQLSLLAPFSMTPCCYMALGI